MPFGSQPQPQPRAKAFRGLTTTFTVIAVVVAAACVLLFVLLLLSPWIYQARVPDDTSGIGYMLVFLPLIVGALLISSIISLGVSIPALVLSVHARRRALVVLASCSLGATGIVDIAFVVQFMRLLEVSGAVST